MEIMNIDLSQIVTAEPPMRLWVPLLLIGLISVTVGIIFSLKNFDIRNGIVMALGLLGILFLVAFEENTVSVENQSVSYVLEQFHDKDSEIELLDHYSSLVLGEKKTGVQYALMDNGVNMLCDTAIEVQPTDHKYETDVSLKGDCVVPE